MGFLNEDIARDFFVCFLSLLHAPGLPEVKRKAKGTMIQEDAQDSNLVLDRTIFSSTNFSVEGFVDRIANTVLYMPLTRLRAQAGKQKPKTADTREEDPLDFRAIAGSLVTELEKYEKGLAALLIEETVVEVVSEAV